ncbi:hypothetical protein [Bacillus taeanensis]|uniref:Uncharacterized protein n=1 Tax=Bacillus taeanensis TaxID=273032 RepID=A0A366XTX2_9BACI|nr:hypothetical protein [Bacillus taeanensis]RBW68998.1 hypothetical protein DS031_13755 [Bacillus taeanensis]
MSFEHYYHTCCEHIGRTVEIGCRDGAAYRGVIEHVDKEYVYLRPFDEEVNEHHESPNHGLFLWGFGGSFAGGFLGGLTGVALGRIAFFRPYPYYY